MKLFVIMSAAAFALATPVAIAQTEPSQAEQVEQVMLTAKVKGMVCDFCARAVTKVFSKNEAVDSVHVDLDSGEIHVGLKPGKSLSDAEVGALVKKSGYALVSVERHVS